MQRIHIRYEDKVTNPDHPFACGVMMKSLSAETTDKGTHIDSEAKEVLKVTNYVCYTAVVLIIVVSNLQFVFSLSKSKLCVSDNSAASIFSLLECIFARAESCKRKITHHSMESKLSIRSSRFMFKDIFYLVLTFAESSEKFIGQSFYNGRRI